MLLSYIALSVVAVVKGVRSGVPTSYFGNPIGVLPRSGNAGSCVNRTNQLFFAEGDTEVAEIFFRNFARRIAH
jgi:hypothetical protein